jgi:hypothetical protein
MLRDVTPQRSNYGCSSTTTRRPTISPGADVVQATRKEDLQRFACHSYAFVVLSYTRDEHVAMCITGMCGECMHWCMVRVRSQIQLQRPRRSRLAHPSIRCVCFRQEKLCSGRTTRRGLNSFVFFEHQWTALDHLRLHAEPSRCQKYISTQALVEMCKPPLWCVSHSCWNVPHLL